MFIVGAIVVFILILLGAFYLYGFFGRGFEFFGFHNVVAIKWISIITISLLLVMAFINPMGTGTIVFGYFMVFALLFDGIGLIYRKFFIDSIIFKYVYSGGIPAVLITAIIITMGIINGYNVQMTKYTITTEKELPNEKLRIALISDAHVGVTITTENLPSYCEDIQAQNPDIVLLVGDLFDDRTSIEEMELACKSLGNLTSTYGTYFVWGNHDTASIQPNSPLDKEMVEANLLQNGITILDDEVILIDDSFYLVGRVDPEVSADRLSAEILMSEIDTDKPIIVMDHQPLDYELMASLEADLQVSGHTHGGQMPPVGVITKMIYGHTYGQKMINEFNVIVSSGLGTWNTPIRLGSISEYVIIDMISTP